MLTEFIKNKLKNAKYTILKNGSFFGTIPGIQGVWVNAKNLESCRSELQEVLEDWLVLQLRDRRKINGFSIKAAKIKNSRVFHYA